MPPGSIAQAPLAAPNDSFMLYVQISHCVEVASGWCCACSSSLDPCDGSLPPRATSHIVAEAPLFQDVQRRQLRVIRCHARHEVLDAPAPDLTPNHLSLPPALSLEIAGTPQ